MPDAQERARQQSVPDSLVLEEGLPADEVERRLLLAFAAAGLRHRVIAFYLQDVDARGLHQLAGCRTAALYASRHIGMSRREAHDLLVAGRALRELPLIDAAFADGRLCWSKVRALARVATPQHEARWLERAMALHIDELSLEVQLRNPGDPPRNRDDRKGLPEIRMRINATVPADVYAKWEQARAKIQDESGGPLQEWEFVEALCDLALASSPEGSVPGRVHSCDSPYCVVVNVDSGTASVQTEDGPVSIDQATAEMIGCDAGCIDPSCSDQEADRRVRDGLRHRVLARDGCRCRVCGRRRCKHNHHIIPVGQGGLTRIDNLITLCRGCHTLLHERLIILEGDADSARFFDRKGRDLHGPGNSTAQAIKELAAAGIRLVLPSAQPRPAAPQIVELADVPDVIDGEWWRRHSHLLSFNERTGSFEFRPGAAAEPDGNPAEVGTMCHNGSAKDACVL